MKHLKHYITICLTILAISAAAQEQADTTLTTPATRINREVDVVNTYLPTISNPFKLQVEPVVDDTMSYKPRFTYNILRKVQTVTTPPDSLQAATMRFRQDESPYHAMVKAYGGNYGNIYAQLFYNIGLSEKYHVSLDVGHHSMLGKVKLENDEKVKATNSDTWAQVDTKTYFKRTVLGARVDFRNLSYRYYGLQTLADTLDYITLDGDTVVGGQLTDSPKQHFTTFDLHVDFGNSLVDRRRKFTYNVYAGFGIANNKTEVSQFDIHAGGTLRKPFATNYYVGGDIDVNYFKVSVPDYEGYAYNFAERNHTDINIRPRFGIDFDRVQLRLGVRFIAEIGDDDDDIFMLPDIRGDFTIAEGIFSMYAGIVGDYNANSFRSLIERNRYVASDACNYIWKAYTQSFVSGEAMPTTQQPIALIAGLKVTFSPKVELHGGIDFHSFDDELFFVNKGYSSTDGQVGYINQFGIVAENGKLFTARGELHLRPTPNYLFLLTATYYKWNLDYLEEPWYKPTFDLGLGARMKPMERLLLTFNVDLVGKRYAYDRTALEKTELDMIADIALGAEYYLTSRWTIFAQLCNIAAQDQLTWLGYSTYRFQAFGGFTFKF